MNSKSFDSKQNYVDQVKENKTFQFVKLYKSAAESTKQFETTKPPKKAKNLTKSSQSGSDMSNRSRSPNKNKKGNETLDLSNIETVDHRASKTKKSFRKSSLNPIVNIKEKQFDNAVKSIMKNKSNDVDSVLSINNISAPSTKPKKRNKSVSFMLDDAEEVVVKKSKSNESSKQLKNQDKELKSKEKAANKTLKQRKNVWSRKHQSVNEDITKLSNKENIKNDAVVKNQTQESISVVPITEEMASGVKKNMKTAQRSKPESEKIVKTTEENDTREPNPENKSRKLKKKKRKAKSMQEDNTGASSAEGEPCNKAPKKDLKPEAIARGLENLNIGDNAHTLIDLLDEMTVVDKNKKIKNRQKQKKTNKTIASENKKQEAFEQDDNTEEKEKVKWSNRKWNKDTKGDGRLRLHTSVVVEHLPLKIMCNYKTLLSEHFGKFGTIAGIGVAEAYPTEDCKPVFTTTVFFQEEEAAIKSLEEDNTQFQGNRIRVRRPRPPTETTLVVRAFALSDQGLSSLFSSAGRVRAIRQLIKGKKSMPTAFVEFDGPEAVERALKLAENATINGKKMYVSKFEVRQKGKSMRSEEKSINGGDHINSIE